MQSVHTVIIQNVNDLKLVRAHEKSDGIFCANRLARECRRGHDFSPVSSAVGPCPEIAVPTYEEYSVCMPARGLHKGKAGGRGRGRDTAWQLPSGLWVRFGRPSTPK